MTYYLMSFLLVALAPTIIHGKPYDASTEKKIHQVSNSEIPEPPPVELQDLCPENMHLVVGYSHDSNSGKCVCNTGLVYFSDLDKCYDVYEQGPCGPGKYVYLPENETIPVCKENPCMEEDLVLFNGKCYGLRTTHEDPCGPETTLTIGENLQLQCSDVPWKNEEPSSAVINPPPKIVDDTCPPGKRKALGVCRILF